MKKKNGGGWKTENSTDEEDYWQHQSPKFLSGEEKGCGNRKLEQNLYIAFQPKMVTEIMKVYVSLPPSLLFLAS